MNLRRGTLKTVGDNKVNLEKTEITNKLFPQNVRNAPQEWLDLQYK